MNQPSFNRRSWLQFLVGCGCAIWILAICGIAGWLAEAGTERPTYQRTSDIIYGRKHGTALTLDLFRPTQTNGCALVFVVSGGFFSSREAINPPFYGPLLQRGYVVAAVVHGSQPKFQIPEIEQDIHRAIRWLRHNAATLGFQPDKIGILGASAGGHLSLMMGVRGGLGDPKARDVIDRGSSAVQAVACFFPPTDFLNWSRPGDDAVGVGTLEKFGPAFGPRRLDPQQRAVLGAEISPLYYVTSNTSPTLIIHGDADKLVPMYQARQFLEKCANVHVPTKLVVREGKEHGWAGIEKDVDILADWFDHHLRGQKSAP